MRTALKEWAAVIEALARGDQILLLRKGGIAEGKHGFQPLHREFLFFPTWEHQHRDLIRPEFADLFDRLPAGTPDILRLTCSAQVEKVILAPEDPSVLVNATGHHIWSPNYIKQRYEYRPDLPIFLLILRLYRLSDEVHLPYDRRYEGCRSWVELNVDVSTGEAIPVLPDTDFQHRIEALRRDLGHD